MADCRKGEKYGKGLLVDAGEAFEEQGNGKEQKADLDKDKGTEEEFVTRNDGPLFMVIRCASPPRKVEDGDEQWHNLFHSRCTIGGKVSQLVIDLGSC